MKRNFGPWLKKFREKRGINKFKLQTLAGLQHPTLWRLEEDQYKSVSYKIISGLANVFEMKGWQLLKLYEEDRLS